MQNALLLSSGSKVALARIAQKATRKRGMVLHATDSQTDVPTKRIVDAFHTLDLNQGTDPLLELCKANNIGLVIPTRHSDLLPLATNHGAFQSAGITLALSSFETIITCIDKFKTADFLEKNNLPAPRSFRGDQTPTDQLKANLPLVSKPSRGSSSQGLRYFDSPEELDHASFDATDIIQTRAPGIEYTIYVYIAKDGDCLAIIPHRRLTVENGESVQAITERNEVLMELARSAVQALPTAWGPINIQAFYDSDSNSAQIIEINPRLGGGYPLADQAKGHFVEWLFQETFDNQSPRPVDNWTSGLRMMRFRDAIFDFPASTSLQ